MYARYARTQRLFLKSDGIFSRLPVNIRRNLLSGPSTTKRLAGDDGGQQRISPRTEGVLTRGGECSCTRYWPGLCFVLRHPLVSYVLWHRFASFRWVSILQVAMEHCSVSIFVLAHRTLIGADNFACPESPVAIVHCARRIRVSVPLSFCICIRLECIFKRVQSGESIPCCCRPLLIEHHGEGQRAR